MFVSSSSYLDALSLLLGDNSERSRTLVKEFLEATDKSNAKKEIVTVDDELIGAYRSLIASAIAEGVSQDNKSAAKMMLLKLKSHEVFKSYPSERDILIDILDGSEPVDATRIDYYLKGLRNSLLSAQIEQDARVMFAKARSIAEIKDYDLQAAEIEKYKKTIEAIGKTIEAKQYTGQVQNSLSYISMSDDESLARALDTFMDRSVNGIIRTGLQGLNKALGSRGGMGLGESVVFAASSHNYKTGMLLSILVWTVIYNKIVVAPGKKALAYFVSLENETYQNLVDIFKMLYSRVEKKDVDVAQLGPEFIKGWIKDYFSKFDVEVIIDRFTPHDFSYNEFMRRYNHFAELNYQMILFDLDYMSEARGIDPGDTMSAQGTIQLIKENYTKFCQAAKQLGFLLATGHQLTKKAEETAGQYPNAVKRFNPSMIADSSDVHRTVDMLFYMQLETNIDGHKFLTCINRKNRYCKDTPEKDKFFAYPFTKYGIEDDLNGLPGCYTDINAYVGDGAVNDSEVEEAALF